MQSALAYTSNYSPHDSEYILRFVGLIVMNPEILIKGLNSRGKRLRMGEREGGQSTLDGDSIDGESWGCGFGDRDF
jgi:hypothetical protein